METSAGMMFGAILYVALLLVIDEWSSVMYDGARDAGCEKMLAAC